MTEALIINSLVLLVASTFYIFRVSLASLLQIGMMGALMLNSLVLPLLSLPPPLIPKLSSLVRLHQPKESHSAPQPSHTSAPQLYTPPSPLP
jgi:hypothetical protein